MPNVRHVRPAPWAPIVCCTRGHRWQYDALTDPATLAAYDVECRLDRCTRCGLTRTLHATVGVAEVVAGIVLTAGCPHVSRRTGASLVGLAEEHHDARLYRPASTRTARR